MYVALTCKLIMYGVNQRFRTLTAILVATSTSTHELYKSHKNYKLCVLYVSLLGKYAKKDFGIA